ncbi:MAG: hypothetical protein ACI9DC_000031 [Gammaproteobacteria bacterium]|jgi:hypothetical protein
MILVGSLSRYWLASRVRFVGGFVGSLAGLGTVTGFNLASIGLVVVGALLLSGWGLKKTKCKRHNAHDAMPCSEVFVAKAVLQHILLLRYKQRK